MPRVSRLKHVVRDIENQIEIKSIEIKTLEIELSSLYKMLETIKKHDVKGGNK